MRPEDFSPGNARSRPSRRDQSRSFNEAGGFLPRKRTLRRSGRQRQARASMRPEDFSPGNRRGELIDQLLDCVASMRPEDFSPGN